MAAFVTYNDQRAIGATLYIPEGGLWVVDLIFDGTPTVDTAQRASTIVLGDLTLSGGTVDPDNTGTFATASKVRVVGGSGWRSTLPALWFHNDAGVKVSHVASSTASSCGEPIGTMPSDFLGADFTRRQQSGASTLSEILGAWYVDETGTAQAGARAASALDSTAYQLLDFDPMNRIVTLATDSPAVVMPGKQITDARLPQSLQIRAIELTVGKQLRIAAWVKSV